MLVLSRKLGERICIGQNIFVTVVDVERGKVRLGVEAPRDMPIYRSEVFEAIQSKAREQDEARAPVALAGPLSPRQEGG